MDVLESDSLSFCPLIFLSFRLSVLIFRTFVLLSFGFMSFCLSVLVNL